jgi:ribosomal protein L22
VADDKEQPKNDEPKAKPKPRRAVAKKTSAAEEKPKRTRAAAKPKAAGDEKPKAPSRRRAAPKAKAADSQAPASKAAEKASETAAEKAPGTAAEKPAGPAKAPARRRRAAPRREAPKAPPVRPVVTARAKYVRSSARKARLVLDHIRGKEIAEARALLRHSPRGIARDIERLLDSAVANAENNHELVGDDLLVKEIYADEGPTIKRFRARAQGRAYRIRKRTSHLTVALIPKE